MERERRGSGAFYRGQPGISSIGVWPLWRFRYGRLPFLVKETQPLAISCLLGFSAMVLPASIPMSCRHADVMLMYGFFFVLLKKNLGTFLRT